MRLALAPMEGLVDPLLRELLTEVGGLDWCVTEFVRVTTRLLPAAVFHRYAPEAHQGWRTASGVPVHLQLLGSDPACLADNAALAAALGAPVIDLNFGCPAKTVNRSRGGAILLREPELLERIVRAVRAAVPAAVPVTAKMRLGYEHTDLALDCARALESGGAAQLVVHARTKVQGYQPPAHWEWIARIREAVAVTVYANGEIWSVADWQRCRAVSGAADFMLGRGLVALPDLARQVRAAAAGQTPQPQSRGERLALVERFWQRLLQQTPPAYAAGRLKQWWVLLMCGDRALAPLWSEIKRERDPQAIGARLAAARAQALSEEATSSATRSPDSSAPST